LRNIKLYYQEATYFYACLEDISRLMRPCWTRGALGRICGKTCVFIQSALLQEVHPTYVLKRDKNKNALTIAKIRFLSGEYDRLGVAVRFSMAQRWTGSVALA
jgi:hypothetical protein